MRKIVLISPAHPLRGGIASSTERLAQEFQLNGYQVVIYSFSLQYPGFLFPGKTQYTDDPVPAGLSIKSVINSVNPNNWIRVGRQIRKEQADLILVRYWLPFMGPALGTILRFIKKKKQPKVIAIADNIIPHEKRIGDQAFTRYFIKPVDGFIVMSRSVGDDIRKFSSAKPVNFVPHPIYDNYGSLVPKAEAKAHLGLTQNQSYLLFFGFIRAYKGLDLLIKAMGNEKVRELGLKLIVAGEFYGDRTKYDELIKSLGLNDQILLFSNFIPHDEVKYYFGAADLVVQPYKSATQSGISQLAYHFEKPMVVTKVGGLPEIVADGRVGYVVEVNERAIARSIVDFFQNNREATFTEGVRADKSKFSWNAMVNRILSLEDQIKS